MLEYLISETKNGRQLSPSPVICLAKRVSARLAYRRHRPVKIGVSALFPSTLYVALNLESTLGRRSLKGGQEVPARFLIIRIPLWSLNSI